MFAPCVVEGAVGGATPAVPALWVVARNDADLRYGALYGALYGELITLNYRHFTGESFGVSTPRKKAAARPSWCMAAGKGMHHDDGFF